MESLATGTNAVSTNNTNSNSSSSSSGYGSATTTPLGHYESHVTTTPENAATSTSPSPVTVSSNAPTAVAAATTIATVAPYAYSETHLTTTDGQHRQQYQYTTYNYPATSNSQQQQHNPYVGLNYVQHTAPSATTSNEYNISDLTTTKERSIENNTATISGSNNIIKHATHSPIEKLTAYANLSSTPQHVAANNNNAYKQNSAHLPSMTDMPSKPQATATPFYAAPPRVSAYYDQYKFKMPTAVGAEYANYGCRIPGNSSTYQQQQQQYYAAAKSQLSEVNYGGGTSASTTKPPLSPTSVMRQQMSSLYGRSNAAAGASYYDKYEKYGSYTLPSPTNATSAIGNSNMSLPTTNETTGATTYTTLHPPPSAATHYSAAESTPGSYRKSSTSNWHYMDYSAGNYRTLPPPTAIPTAAIPPSNASYLSSSSGQTTGSTRDAYYSKFDKYNAYAYHHQQQQQQHQQQQQQHQQQHQQQAATASTRNLWTASPTHQHMSSTAIPHPTAAYQPPPPPYAPHHFAATANVGATRQNCCTQSSAAAYHQPQSCYYPRVPTQHVTNAYPPHHPHAHAHSHSPPHSHPHHMQQNSQHYGSSNKYVTNPILDYPMSSKLKYGNTDLMTAAAMPYDAAAASYSYNYAAATQRYAAAASGAQHQHSDSTTAAAAYYNDLNLQSTYENYATATTQQQQQQQHTHQYQQHGATARAQHLSYHHHPPPQSNHVKNPLLDYRKPANTASVPTAAAIVDNCYMQESSATNSYQQNYQHSGASTATSLYAIETASDDNDPDAEKEEEEEDGVTKNLSIRDFIATWNDDEDDVAAAAVAATEFNYVESAQSSQTSTTADNHVKILHSETIPAPTTTTHYLHEQQQQHYTPPLVENHLQFKGSFSTRPKIHVGITVDGNVDDKHFNLPDIIIDIEKASNAGSGVSTAAAITPSFENFDVEKELDELQIRKSKIDTGKQILTTVVAEEHLKSNNDNTTLRMRNTAVESVNTAADNDIVSKHTFTGVLDATKSSSVDAALSKIDSTDVGRTPLEVCGAKVETATQHNFETPEQLLKEMEYDSTSLSNESTFEKEYETFINKIGSDVETVTCVDKKLTVENLKQSVENVTVTLAAGTANETEEKNGKSENTKAKELDLENNEIANAKNVSELVQAMSEIDKDEDAKTINNITIIEEKVFELEATAAIAEPIEVKSETDIAESVATESKKTSAELIDENSTESIKHDDAESEAISQQSAAEQKSPKSPIAELEEQEDDSKNVELNMSSAAEPKSPIAELEEQEDNNKNVELNMSSVAEPKSPIAEVEDQEDDSKNVELNMSSTAEQKSPKSPIAEFETQEDDNKNFELNIRSAAEQKSPKSPIAEFETQEDDNKSVELNMNSAAELRINQPLITETNDALTVQPSHNHKFYKRKRKLIDDANNEEQRSKIETAPDDALLQNSNSNKIRVATAAEKKQMYDQNFPIVYTKTCRKRKLLPAIATNVAAVSADKRSRQVAVLSQQQQKRKPKSFYYKMLHTLRRNSKLKRKFAEQIKQQQRKNRCIAAAAAAIQKERHLPLIKRQSIKKYAIANSGHHYSASTANYFNPKTLKSLSVSILNTEKFRQRVFPHNQPHREINLTTKSMFEKKFNGAVEELKTADLQQQETVVVSDYSDDEELKTTDLQQQETVVVSDYSDDDFEEANTVNGIVVESKDIIAELVSIKEFNDNSVEPNAVIVVESKQQLSTTMEAIVTNETPQQTSCIEVENEKNELVLLHDFDNKENQLNCQTKSVEEDVLIEQSDLNASQSYIIKSFSSKDVENEVDECENLKVNSKEQKIVYDYSSSTSSEDEVIEEIHSIDGENSTESNVMVILKNQYVADDKNTENKSNYKEINNKVESETFDDASNSSISSSSSSSSSSESDTSNDDNSSSSSSDDNDTDIDADDDTTSSTTITSSDESDLNEMLALERELSSTTQCSAITAEKTVKNNQHNIDNVIAAHDDDCEEKSIDKTIEAEKKRKNDISKKQITSHDIANLKKVLEGVEENEELHAEENVDKLQNDYVEIVASKPQNESEKSVEFVERRQQESVQQQQFLTEIPSLKTLAKTVVDEKCLVTTAVENFTIPKLSDLCKNALNSSCNENITTTTTTLLMLNATDSDDDFQALLDEAQQQQQLYLEEHQQQRELSVEEALAEMYRQAGVASDPEDFGDTDDKEAQEVLLINLEEILVDSDNDNLYVLQCDMNENILGVITTQTTENQNDENNDEYDVENDDVAGNSNRLNTLELIELFQNATIIKETEANNSIQIINTNDNLIISTANDPIPIKFLQSSPTSPEPDYNPSTYADGKLKNPTNFVENFMNPLSSSSSSPPPASISTTSTNLPPNIIDRSDHEIYQCADVQQNDNDDSNDSYDANIAAHFDSPTIHHEEIVPDNYKNYQNEKFLKYLHAKYVQKSISKFYHANRIVKKYKKRLIKKLINVMEVDKNSRCGKFK